MIATEQSVRNLRDMVYEKPSTDKNWAGCGEFWMRPESTMWLVRQCKKMDDLAQSAKVKP